jgi:alpha-tubulin suppressor-like RCC1 family protein
MRRVVILVSTLVTFAACFSFGDLQGGDGIGGADAGSDVTISDANLEGSADSGCGDLTTSSANCGACNHACDAGVSCTGGKCGDEIIQLAAHDVSGRGACALMHDGTVWCWGDSLDGGGAPARIPNVEDGVEIAMGAGHGCARLAEGGVSCWGDNGFGQLGSLDGGTVPMPFRASAKRIFASNLLSCALTTTDDLDCWGQGDNAMLEMADGGAPLSNYGTYLPSRLLSLPTDMLDMTLVASHACLITANGVLQCWGINESGELGHDVGTYGDLDYGLIVNPYPGTSVSFFQAFPSGQSTGGPVKHALMAATFGCAVADSIPLFACWGGDAQGTLGNGNNTDNSDPNVVSTLSGTSMFAISDSTVFVTDINGVSWAWGNNFNGALALGNLQGMACNGGQHCSNVPVKTLLPKNVAQVALGEDYGVALVADGSVLAWGSNDQGQLGHASGTHGDDPNCGSANDGGLSFGMGICNPTPTMVQGLP